jgi:hypothetical protein
MPNWCSNTATISGPRPVIDEIRNILSDREQDSRLLKWMRPMPEDQEENWYDWCVTNWGTKWDITNAFVSDDTEEDSITFSFDTAWGSPVEAFRHWAQQDGRVNYRLSYIEEGMMFVGWDSYDGEYFDDDVVDHEDDPGRYWEMAGEEFGIEQEEEPEPLTEWYVEGVREKGLTNE